MRALVSGLVGLCFVASVASAQDGAGAVTAPHGAGVHIPLVQQLLADPTIRNHVGLTENNWDFSSPDSIPGFGPMTGPRTTTGVGSRD